MFACCTTVYVWVPHTEARYKKAKNDKTSFKAQLRRLIVKNTVIITQPGKLRHWVNGIFLYSIWFWNIYCRYSESPRPAGTTKFTLGDCGIKFKINGLPLMKCWFCCGCGFCTFLWFIRSLYFTTIALFFK